jgi:acyl dehydratase/NADP-dependent 3-hydroxy acid dehydrogenase YdfG
MGDQHLFAELSGDYNPVHVDPEQARRTVFGHAVVHGVHGLMWALDCWLRTRSSQTVCVVALRAQFRKQIPIGTEATVRVLDESSDQFTLAVVLDGEVATSIEGRFSTVPVSMTVLGASVNREACADWDITDAASTSGTLPLGIDGNLLRRLFPSLAQCLPAIQAAELVATTRLVGMVCPGLQSLFLSLDLQSGVEQAAPAELAYRVKRANPRVRSVDLAVTGPTLQGVLATLVRPRPQPQPSMSEVRTALGEAYFAGQRALIVGGSRGIGEVTAKCIAAGGGSVAITYLRGESDARRVVEEITAAGGNAYAICLDCLQPSSGLDQQLQPLGTPSHLYYFATPQISLKPKQLFSASVFHEMSRYYVDGFAALVQALHPLSGGNLTVFYPSTIFLDQPEPGSGEYCAAKAAGEAVCRHLGSVLPGTRFLAPRLPRMRTDQTAGVLPVKSLEPLAVMAQILREMDPSQAAGL